MTETFSYEHNYLEIPMTSIVGLQDALDNAGGTGSGNIDGGSADSVYTTEQVIDCGGA